jgi:hypothetical protein
MHMVAYNGDEFGMVDRLALAGRVGLDALIQSFIGVQFLMIAWYSISRSRDEWQAATHVAVPDVCTGCPSTSRSI